MVRVLGFGRNLAKEGRELWVNDYLTSQHMPMYAKTSSHLVDVVMYETMQRPIYESELAAIRRLRNS